MRPSINSTQTLTDLESCERKSGQEKERNNFIKEYNNNNNDDDNVYDYDYDYDYDDDDDDDDNNENNNNNSNKQM